MNEPGVLSKNILATITYYDILNFPLTSFEIWKYLLSEKEFSLSEIIEALESNDLRNRIGKFRGFYFLCGRQELVAGRIQGDKNSIVKFEIAQHVARWLRYVPFVRMLAVTGTVAMKNCKKRSDVDFFVVLEKGRIFTGRILVTAVIQILGKRRHGKSIKNRICLNYFTTTGKLEIPRKDIFAANEYSFIFPLFGFRVFREFCRKNAFWIRKFKPNWKAPELKPARYFVQHGRFSRSIQKAFEGLINLLGGDRMETWLKRMQIDRIERNPLTRKPGAYIEFGDENLIFLPEPQGAEIERGWKKKIDATS